MTMFTWTVSVIARNKTLTPNLLISPGYAYDGESTDDSSTVLKSTQYY